MHGAMIRNCIGRNGDKLSILRRCFAIVGIGLLVLAWPPCRAAADTPAGCDGLTTLPVEGFLSRPQNLAVIKQQLLVYRRAKYDYELERVVREAEASAPPHRARAKRIRFAALQWLSPSVGGSPPY